MCVCACVCERVCVHVCVRVCVCVCVYVHQPEHIPSELTFVREPHYVLQCSHSRRTALLLRRFTFADVLYDVCSSKGQCCLISVGQPDQWRNEVHQPWRRRLPLNKGLEQLQYSQLIVDQKLCFFCQRGDTHTVSTALPTSTPPPPLLTTVLHTPLLLCRAPFECRCELSAADKAASCRNIVSSLRSLRESPYTQAQEYKARISDATLADCCITNRVHFKSAWAQG